MSTKLMTVEQLRADLNAAEVVITALKSKVEKLQTHRLEVEDAYMKARSERDALKTKLHAARGAQDHTAAQTIKEQAETIERLSANLEDAQGMGEVAQAMILGLVSNATRARQLVGGAIQILGGEDMMSHEVHILSKAKRLLTNGNMATDEPTEQELRAKLEGALDAIGKLKANHQSHTAIIHSGFDLLQEINRSGHKRTRELEELLNAAQQERDELAVAKERMIEDLASWLCERLTDLETKHADSVKMREHLQDALTCLASESRWIR